MQSGGYIENQRHWLLSRRESKLEILKRGGEQALSHSPKDITRIDFALRRIEDGQYGICTQCGFLIEQQRLKIVPETPFCAECALVVEAPQ